MTRPSSKDSRPCFYDHVYIKLTRGSGLRFSGSQTPSAIIGNGAVDNGAAVDTFPCIKHEKEIRESLQHHHACALRTSHKSLPR